MLRRVALSLACLSQLSAGAAAMVGDAAPETGESARHVVLIVGSRGNSCTGVAIAQDLVLTVAHCVLPGADYKLVDYDAAGRPAAQGRHQRRPASAIRPQHDAGPPRHRRCGTAQAG